MQRTLVLNAVNQTLNHILGPRPDVAIPDPDNDGWSIVTITWPEVNNVVKRLKFEIMINQGAGQSLCCILEREGMTYNQGERFMTILYNAIDGRDLEPEDPPPGPMPPLEDVQMNEQGEIVVIENANYDDMPALEGYGGNN